MSVDAPAETYHPAAPAPPRRHTARWIAGGLGLVLMVFVAVLATRDAAINRLSDSPLLGKPAPALAGDVIAVPGAGPGGPTRIALDDFRGRYVVVNFFASWCVPCQREHPELQRFQARHAEPGDATVVAVVFDDEVAAVRSYFAAEGGDWPVIDDPSGRIALDWGVRGPPESFLVDPDGFVLFKITGEVDADGLDRLVRQARSGRPR